MYTHTYIRVCVCVCVCVTGSAKINHIVAQTTSSYHNLWYIHLTNHIDFIYIHIPALINTTSCLQNMDQ